MSRSSWGVAESAVRRLGPLPRRMRLFNMALSQGAVREILGGVPRGSAEPDNVVRPGVDLKASIAERRDWYRITNNAGSPVVVDIFDEIGFWGVNAAAFQRELAQVNASEITVNLSSPGGEIFEGIAIYNALRSHPANVTVRVSALAASIASVIAQAGDRIVMLSGAQMMIHEGSGLCMGNAADMQQMAELLDRQSDNIATIYAERAGGTPDEWRTRMRAETWFNAEEAVASGLADEVESLPRKGEQAEEQVTARWDLSVFNYAGREAAPAPVIDVLATGGVVQNTPIAGEGGSDCLFPAAKASGLEDTASSVHHTATENSAWDGPGAVSNMPNEAAELRYCHAWRDPDGDPDAKSTYKFPHHRKEGGPANMAAVRNGLARLSSADIPEAERAGVEAHLRAHLKDGGGGEDEDHADPLATDQAPEPEPDAWAALTAHLYTPAPDSWAAVVANLTNPTTSHSAATGMPKEAS